MRGKDRFRHNLATILLLILNILSRMLFVEGNNLIQVSGQTLYNLRLPYQRSIRLDQASFVTQVRSALISVLASSISFRISAVMATFGG